jgi:long-chain acyl-CoA synthetase
MRSIFKLSQGEYVAAEMITQVYEDCEYIEQIFVYGDSGKTCLVAIVIPRKSSVAKFLGKSVDEMSLAEYGAACKSERLVEAVLQQMNAAAEAKRLFGFQRVKKIFLDSFEWTMENNYLTPTLKVRRKALADRYQAEIDEMYRQFDEENKTK